MTAIGSSVGRIRNARLRGREGLHDVWIRDGRIVADASARGGGGELDADGGLVLPGLVESHIHLDKALLGSLGGSGELGDAIARTSEAKKRMTREDILRRARRVIDREIAAGTTVLRAHTDVDPTIGLVGVEAMIALRDEYAALLTIQVVAFPQEGVLQRPGTRELLRDALALGCDVLGGCTYSEADVADARVQIDELFALAAEHDVPLDVHADLADDGSDPRYLLGDVIARRRLDLGFADPVTVAHATSWAGVPLVERARVIEAIAAADIGVVVMPATDLHFGGRSDAVAVRRGISPVSALWDAGVRVGCASNNVRNAFTPYGNADPLEAALLLAQSSHLHGAQAHARVLDAITTTAASIVGADGYGVDPGNHADLVVLDAPDEEEALLSRPDRRWVIRRGDVVAQTSSVREVAETGSAR